VQEGSQQLQEQHRLLLEQQARMATLQEQQRLLLQQYPAAVIGEPGPAEVEAHMRALAEQGRALEAAMQHMEGEQQRLLRERAQLRAEVQAEVQQLQLRERQQRELRAAELRAAEAEQDEFTVALAQQQQAGRQRRREQRSANNMALLQQQRALAEAPQLQAEDPDLDWQTWGLPGMWEQSAGPPARPGSSPVRAGAGPLLPPAPAHAGISLALPASSAAPMGQQQRRPRSAGAASAPLA
jgi:hypothetical protein